MNDRENVDRDIRPTTSYDFNSEVNFNPNALQMNFREEDNKILNNFNSKSSKREIPKETLKIVHDIFDDSDIVTNTNIANNIVKQGDQNLKSSVERMNQNFLNFNKEANNKIKLEIPQNDDFNFSLFSPQNDNTNKIEKNQSNKLNQNDNFGSLNNRNRNIKENDPNLRTSEIKNIDYLLNRLDPCKHEDEVKNDVVKNKNCVENKNNNKKNKATNQNEWMNQGWGDDWDFNDNSKVNQATRSERDVSDKNYIYSNSNANPSHKENKVNHEIPSMKGSVIEENQFNLIPLSNSIVINENGNDNVNEHIINKIPVKNNNNNLRDTQHIDIPFEINSDILREIQDTNSKNNQFKSSNVAVSNKIDPNRELVPNPNPENIFIDTQASQGKKIKKHNQDKQAEVEFMIKNNQEINFDNILGNLNLKDQVFPNQVNEDEIKINMKNKISNNSKINKIYPHDMEPLGKQINLHLALERDLSYGISKNCKEVLSIGSTDRREQIFKYNKFSLIKEKKILLSKENILPKYFDNLDEDSLNLQIQLFFEDMLINSNNLDEIKNQFNSLILAEGVNCSPVGFLYRVDKPRIPLEGEQLKSLQRDVSGFRSILNDGNGFFRSFMFATIESYILNKEIINIKKILFDINVKIVTGTNLKKHNVAIDNTLINQIFYLIIDELERNNISQAYDLFLKAYHKYEIFDYGLIKYMRIALAEYIKRNQDNIFSSKSFLFNCDLAELIQYKGYISEVKGRKENIFNVNAYLDDILLAMHNEADIIIVYLAPILFNINLNLFVLEGLTRQVSANGLEAANENKQLNFFKLTFPCLLLDNKENNLSATISLFYRFSSYDVFYDTSLIRQSNCFLTFSYFQIKDKINAYGQKGNNIERITIFAQIACEICNRESELLIFSHIPRITLCRLCTVDFVNSIIIKRSKNFITEYFSNIEYYCRPINIDQENKFMLFDEDVFYLIKKTISQLFLELLDHVCSICQHSLTKIIYNMPCGCKICDKCCDNMINIMTDKKIVLNSFEKKYSEKIKRKCACGKIFDLDHAIAVSVKHLEPYMKTANERLNRQVEKYCAMCCTDVYKNEDIEIKAKIPANAHLNQKFPVIPEPYSKLITGYHILCKQCIYTVKGDIMRLNSEGKLKSIKTIPIKCKICDDKVHQVELKVLKPLMKDGDGGCCFIL